MKTKTNQQNQWAKKFTETQLTDNRKTRARRRGDKDVAEREPEKGDTKQMKEHLNSKNAYKIKFNQPAS